MPGNRARTLGVLAALASATCLAGCAGAGERLPECRGKAVPINAASVPAAATATLSGVTGEREDGAGNAH